MQGELLVCDVDSFVSLTSAWRQSCARQRRVGFHDKAVNKKSRFVAG